MAKKIFCIVLLSLLLAAASPAAAQDYPIPQIGEPTSVVFNRDEMVTPIIHINGEYRAYWGPRDDYKRGMQFVKVSNNGTDWADLKYVPDSDPPKVEPIIDPDVTHLDTNQVMYERYLDGVYHAWVSSSSDGTMGHHDVYHLTSSDGKDYTLIQPEPVLTHGDDGRITHPWLIEARGQVFMYYVKGTNPPFGIALAIQDTDGNWVKQGQVIEPPAGSEQTSTPMVHYNGSYFEMFYFMGAASGHWIMYAVSQDGVNWQTLGPVEGLEETYLMGLAVPDGNYWIWYSDMSGNKHLVKAPLPRLAIDGCETGIADVEYMGLRLSDWVADARAVATGLGNFVGRLDRLAAEWLVAGVIDEAQRNNLLCCAAKASVERRCISERCRVRCIANRLDNCITRCLDNGNSETTCRERCWNRVWDKCTSKCEERCPDN